MVIWLIGLSASGKTTIAREVCARLRGAGRSVVMIDGDIIRTLFNNDVDHSLEGRRLNAERLSHLSKFVSDQGVDVVAAVLSIFPDWREWNRRNLAEYREVYLKVSMDTLYRRETKGIYRRALQGELKNVVGIDIPFPEPHNADLVIQNDIDRTDLDPLVSPIISLLIE